MSAKLVMAGPGQLVVHDVSHNLESLFYILVGICVLLDEPFKFKSNDDLSRCFDKYFNTFEPSVLKSVIIQSDLTWFPMIIDHISTYFKPLLPLLTRLRPRHCFSHVYQRGWKVLPCKAPHASHSHQCHYQYPPQPRRWRMDALSQS